MPFVSVGWGKFIFIIYIIMVNRLCAEGDLDENGRPNDGRLRKMANLFYLILECSDCVWN